MNLRRRQSGDMAGSSLCGSAGRILAVDHKPIPTRLGLGAISGQGRGGCETEKPGTLSRMAGTGKPCAALKSRGDGQRHVEYPDAAQGTQVPYPLDIAGSRPCQSGEAERCGEEAGPAHEAALLGNHNVHLIYYV